MLFIFAVFRPIILSKSHRLSNILLKPIYLKPSLGRRCVDTELVATEKSSTDTHRSVTTLGRHKRAYDHVELVADRKYPVAESRPCSTSTTS